MTIHQILKEIKIKYNPTKTIVIKSMKQCLYGNLKEEINTALLLLLYCKISSSLSKQYIYCSLIQSKIIDLLTKKKSNDEEDDDKKS